MFTAISNYLKERASSTIIISFALFYILCNCRWIFVSFFTDQDLIFQKTELLKNEYIYQNFYELHYDSIWFWICTLLPFLLTYLYVWWIPKIITNPAYKKQISYATERRKYKLEAENSLLLLKNETIKTESKTTKELIDLENKKKKLDQTNPELKLDEEFQQFTKNKNWIMALNELQDIVYGSNPGYIPDDMNSQLLMLLDINGLVETDNIGNQLFITDKGKEFLKRAAISNSL